MKKQTIKLDSNRMDLLKRITNPDYDINPRAKKKAKVILLRYEGKRIKDIQQETKLCKRTIISYIKEYNNLDVRIGGMRFIHKNEYKTSSLNIKDINGDYVVLKELRENPPHSYREASERINNLFNITISESATRSFLNKHRIYTKRSKNPIRDKINYSNKNDRH